MEQIEQRESWRTVFIGGLGGLVSPLATLSSGEMEKQIFKQIKEMADNLRALNEKVKDRRKIRTSTSVDYVILITLLTTMITYRLIHTCQMILVQLSAQIDRSKVRVVNYLYLKKVYHYSTKRIFGQQFSTSYSRRTPPASSTT